MALTLILNPNPNPNPKPKPKPNPNPTKNVFLFDHDSLTSVSFALQVELNNVHIKYTDKRHDFVFVLQVKVCCNEEPLLTAAISYRVHVIHHTEH